MDRKQVTGGVPDMEQWSYKRTILAAALGGVILAILLVGGTIWMGKSAQKDTVDAVRSVSLLYLDEMAGRREQVVSKNLNDTIDTINIATELISDEDLSDLEHMRAYQREIKKLFHLERFAFVDEDEKVYTADEGIQDDIDQYAFDPKTIEEPEISIKNLEESDKKVVIAVPVKDKNLYIVGKKLTVCFMQIDMDTMLQGVSIENQQSTDSTFCNIYTSDGVALTNTVLGGLAEEDNLLEALQQADYLPGYSADDVIRDFKEGKKGIVSFTYNGIHETLSYVPVAGTNWFLTYLIRESVISERISALSYGIISRSVLLSVLIAAVLAVMFAFIIRQNKRNAMLRLEKETSEAENRIKHQEMAQKLALQEKVIEQQEMLKDALKAAEQANKAKTAFLSNVSHEIRTPMNAIIGLENIAINDPTASEQVKGYLEKSAESARHLLSIINDILDMSRIESGKMVIKNEEFSFARCLEQVNTIIGGQCRDKGLHYECRTVGKIDDYYIGDEVKLKQVILNILSNAVKFTPEGGTVTFLIEEGPRYEHNAVLQFTFRDTGIGMSEEYLPRLFDAFSQEDSSSTSRYGSTGLGMPITKSIVEFMNGHIDVESEKGVGTTFTVTVTLGEAEHVDDTYEEGELEPHEMSVLIIDDDPIALDNAQIVLGQLGIRCDTAQSGEEGVEKVKLRHARRDNYDLLLIDWRMPDMDGVETTRQIRSVVGYNTPIIILTSYNWDDIEGEAIKAGVDTFASKPLFAGNVMDQFRDAFRKKNAALVEERADLKGRRILLAEDVPVNAEIMVMVLSMREMDVDLAENGRIALDKFAQHEEGYYDAILMDMRMPEMDGLEATRRIRALDRKDAGTIPIIALTANAFDEDVQRSLQAGLNAHLTKPVQPEALFDTLETLIKD